MLRAGPPGPLPVLGVANADMAGVGGKVQDIFVLPEKSGMDATCKFGIVNCKMVKLSEMAGFCIFVGIKNFIV